MLTELLYSWKNAKDRLRQALALKMLAEAEAAIGKWKPSSSHKNHGNTFTNRS